MSQDFFVVREIDLDLKSTPKYWWGDNPFMTHFMYGLSFSFPEGETLFVQAVKHFQQQIKSTELKRKVAVFIGQEAMHGRTHALLNRHLNQSNVAAEKIARVVDQGFKGLSHFLLKHSPRSALALTVALEHLTAIGAAEYFRNDRFIEKFHPGVRSLFVWHAIEEIEHKAVAFDVYVEVGGGYLRRVIWLAIGAGAVLIPIPVMFAMLYQERQLSNLAAAKSWLRQLFGRQGLITSMVPDYLKGFSPTFHPNQIADRETVGKWRDLLTEMTKMKERRPLRVIKREAPDR